MKTKEWDDLYRSQRMYNNMLHKVCFGRFLFDPNKEQETMHQRIDGKLKDLKDKEISNNHRYLDGSENMWDEQTRKEVRDMFFNKEIKPACEAKYSWMTTILDELDIALNDNSYSKREEDKMKKETTEPKIEKKYGILTSLGFSTERYTEQEAIDTAKEMVAMTDEEVLVFKLAYTVDLEKPKFEVKKEA